MQSVRLLPSLSHTDDSETSPTSSPSLLSPNDTNRTATIATPGAEIPSITPGSEEGSEETSSKDDKNEMGVEKMPYGPVTGVPDNSQFNTTADITPAPTQAPVSPVKPDQPTEGGNTGGKEGEHEGGKEGTDSPETTGTSPTSGTPQKPTIPTEPSKPCT